MKTLLCTLLVLGLTPALIADPAPFAATDPTLWGRFATTVYAWCLLPPRLSDEERGFRVQYLTYENLAKKKLRWGDGPVYPEWEEFRLEKGRVQSAEGWTEAPQGRVLNFSWTKVPTGEDTILFQVEEHLGEKTIKQTIGATTADHGQTWIAQDSGWLDFNRLVIQQGSAKSYYEGRRNYLDWILTEEGRTQTMEVFNGRPAPRITRTYEDGILMASVTWDESTPAVVKRRTIYTVKNGAGWRLTYDKTGALIEKEALIRTLDSSGRLIFQQVVFSDGGAQEFRLEVLNDEPNR